MVWWFKKWETDCHQVLLTQSKCYPNLEIYILSITNIEHSLFMNVANYIINIVCGLQFYIYIYIYIKLATVVEGDPNAPFSIAITLRCRGVCYYFPWIAFLYPWSIPYSVKCKARWHQIPFFFLVFGMTQREIEPKSPGLLANTLKLSW